MDEWWTDSVDKIPFHRFAIWHGACSTSRPQQRRSGTFMAVTVHTGTLFGVDSMPVEVEVDLVRRLPGMVIVGLPGGAVRESTDRVRSALSSRETSSPASESWSTLRPQTSGRWYRIRPADCRRDPRRIGPGPFALPTLPSQPRFLAGLRRSKGRCCLR